MSKRSLLVLVLLATLFLTVSCAGIPVSQSQETLSDVVLTNDYGNWSYISFNPPLNGTPNENITPIGSAIHQWEESHSDRTIVSVQIIYASRSSHGYPDKIDGISIYNLRKDSQ